MAKARFVDKATAAESNYDQPEQHKATKRTDVDMLGELSEFADVPRLAANLQSLSLLVEDHKKGAKPSIFFQVMKMYKSLMTSNQTTAWAKSTEDDCPWSVYVLSRRMEESFTALIKAAESFLVASAIEADQVDTAPKRHYNDCVMALKDRVDTVQKCIRQKKPLEEVPSTVPEHLWPEHALKKKIRFELQQEANYSITANANNNVADPSGLTAAVITQAVQAGMRSNSGSTSAGGTTNHGQGRGGGGGRNNRNGGRGGSGSHGGTGGGRGANVGQAASPSMT